MEKRQLDFNAPILSARRYSSPSRSTELGIRKTSEKPLPQRQQSLPPNNPRWEENDQVSKSVAVPFHWEQIPGRPKNDTLTSGEISNSNTPRLPPARISDAIRRNSGESPRLTRVSGPARYASGERSNDHNTAPRSQVESFSYSDHAMLLEKLNESFNCKEESDSESGDDEYSDALETLSVTESPSLNYSVSGISGNHSSSGIVKPSGTFCIDEQTRDLMMNRFLPAAKAAVIETPQYVSKKSSPVVNDQPKIIRRAVSGEIMKPLSKEYRSNVLPYYSQYIDYTESEDEEQEYKAPVKKSWKVWGILPRFCVKNSLCLLNPLPVMKSKTRPPTPPTPPSATEVRRLSRKALSGPLDMSFQSLQNTLQPNKKKFHSGLLTRDVPGIDARDSIKLSVSPLRRYRSGNISPYRNESPRSPFREGSGFLGLPKDSDNQIAYKIASSRKMLKALQDVSRNPVIEKQSPGKNSDDAVEKTLYVDFVNKLETPRMRASNRRVGDFNAVKFDQETNKKLRALPWAPKVGCVANGVEDIKSDQSLDSGTTPSESMDCDHPLKSTLPPPLPKSPSESWLWRTLPSISLSNPFANSHPRSYLQSKKTAQKCSAVDAKWETIVKTSNPRYDHIRYSEVHRQSKA